jgi:hypothetical protein
VHGMAFTGDISKLYFDINFDTKDATVVTSDKSLGAVVIKYNYGYEKSSINLYSKQDIAAQGSPLVNSDHFTSNDGFYGIPRGFARSRINDAFGKSADAVWNTFIRGKGALYTDNWPWASNVEYRFTTNIGFNSTEYKLVIDVLYKD